MNPYPGIAYKAVQVNPKIEETLLEIFSSDKRKGPWKWLRHKLEIRGIESQFASIIAKHEAAGEYLFKFDPSEINKFMHSLIREFEKAGFSKKIALRNPGRLRELKRLGLPVTSTTIALIPGNLLKKRQELRRLGLSVNATTICCRPESLLKNKRKLKRLGLPVNAYTICHKPESLLKNRQEIERSGLSVISTIICGNPKSITQETK
ncbi:hypothetical protein KJA15_02250 [Patescibacteria group bacterium]|nr:hypothetical protein [Patescibacteria group bacterium]